MRGLVPCLFKRYLKLPLRGRCPACLSRDCPDSCLGAERLQDAQYLSADGTIDSQAADRDAACGAVVHAGAVAAVAADDAPVLAFAIELDGMFGRLPERSCRTRAADAGLALGLHGPDLPALSLLAFCERPAVRRRSTGGGF
jgi:hypothetical protein